MPIDRDKALALELAPVTVSVEAGQLRFFAQAIGETDPAYAEQAPPTYFFSLELESPDPFGYLEELGIDLRHVLHGEQAFVYNQPARAGDVLTLQPRITDVVSKSGGAMELIHKHTNITRDGELVAEATSTIVVRNPEVTA